jgi:predicted ATPase/DNA-binding SARP family transcriptional activator
VELRLSISVLGAPAITLDGAPVRGLVSRKAAALVYYLAATGRSHTRETLAGLLWGETSETQAQKNLRDVLSNLRRLLEPYLLITRQTVSFAPDTALVDSRRFETLLEMAHQPSATEGLQLLRDAVALYRGDFLSGFSVADAPMFEEWALIERERLRQLAMDALHSLAGRAAEHGAYQEGIVAATRLLALDPTREEAHRQLLLLLALSGQRGAALAQYETCRRVLNDELGLDPDDETEALYRRLLDGEVTVRRVTPVAIEQRRPLYHLPAPLSVFIGRETEIGQVMERLRSRGNRLVTITGAGGAGKTRLALEAARQLLPASQAGEVFAHGITFVALAAVEGAGLDDPRAFPALAARVADALRFTFAGQEAPQVQLAHYLCEKDLLLVLDNCEHLPVASFAVELLEQAPQLTVLATSRGRLNVRGEQVVELDGLDFPGSLPPTTDDRPLRMEDGKWKMEDRGSKTTSPYSILYPPSSSDPPVVGGQSLAVDLESYSAVQLFQYNAQAVNPRLSWTKAMLAAAARICELVAGLPLGIELAASLVRLMSCEEIARELGASLEFLQSSRSDLPERHQSLRAVFDHSWNLLKPAEQRTLRQLSVFRGGFRRDAAAEIAIASITLLAALVDNSLVRRATGGDQGEARYELPELVRQYAAEKLTEAAEAEQSAVLDRHCRYYTGLLEQRKADLRGSRQQQALAELNQEIENIRVAWRRAVVAEDVDLIERAIEGLFLFYEMRSWFNEGAEAFAQAAARLSELHAASATQQTRRVWGKVLGRQGWCTFQMGRQAEGRALLEQSLAILRSLEAPGELVFPLNYLASGAYYSGDYEQANQLAEEALRVSLACRDQHGVAVAKTVLGQIAYLVGRYEDARRYSRESLATERELGNSWGLVFTLVSLGRVDQALGAYEEAQRSFQEGLAIRAAFGDTRGTALCLNYLGDTAHALADFGEARRCYQESLALFKEIGNQAGAATSLTKLGYNALALHELGSAHAYFYDALRTAWGAQAIPRALEAIGGVAETLAADEPDQARELASLVHHHPAATQESRDRTATILARSESSTAKDTDALSRKDNEAQPLEAIVAALLRIEV